MEAYVRGVSTRSIDDLVKALGADSGISKSEVSRICAELDTQLTALRGRPLDHVRFPYVFLDATYCKARVAHQIVSRAVVIATGITEDGGREVLGHPTARLARAVGGVARPGEGVGRGSWVRTVPLGCLSALSHLGAIAQAPGRLTSCGTHLARRPFARR